MKNLKNHSDCIKMINLLPLKKAKFNELLPKFYSSNDKNSSRKIITNNNHIRKIEFVKTENKIISINKKNIFNIFKQSPKVEEKPKAEKEPEANTTNTTNNNNSKRKN
jgi:hypothetical protein